MTNTTEARCDICQRRDHKPGTYQGHAYAAPAQPCGCWNYAHLGKCIHVILAPAAPAPDFASMTAGARVRFVPAPGAPAIEGELIRAPKLRHSGTGYLLSIRTLEPTPRTFMRNSEDVEPVPAADDTLGINLPPKRQRYHGPTCSHPHNLPYNDECAVWWLRGTPEWRAAHTNLAAQ